MEIRKIVIGSVAGLGMGAAVLAGAGTAGATNDNWHPGDGNWQPGAGIATFSANVKVANGNLNGNKVTLNVLSNNKIGVLNGAFSGNFSNNLINTGKNSFNTTNSNNTSVVKVWKWDNSTHTFVKVDIKDSFNSTTSTNTTVTNGGCVDEEDANNGHGNDCDGDDEGNPGNS